MLGADPFFRDPWTYHTTSHTLRNNQVFVFFLLLHTRESPPGQKEGRGRVTRHWLVHAPEVDMIVWESEQSI